MVMGHNNDLNDILSNGDGQENMFVYPDMGMRSAKSQDNSRGSCHTANARYNFRQLIVSPSMHAQVLSTNRNACNIAESSILRTDEDEVTSQTMLIKQNNKKQSRAQAEQH